MKKKKRGKKCSCAKERIAGNCSDSLPLFLSLSLSGSPWLAPSLSPSLQSYRICSFLSCIKKEPSKQKKGKEKERKNAKKKEKRKNSSSPAFLATSTSDTTMGVESRCEWSNCWKLDFHRWPEERHSCHPHPRRGRLIGRCRNLSSPSLCKRWTF